MQVFPAVAGINLHHGELRKAPQPNPTKKNGVIRVQPVLRRWQNDWS